MIGQGFTMSGKQAASVKATGFWLQHSTADLLSGNRTQCGFMLSCAAIPYRTRPPGFTLPSLFSVQQLPVLTAIRTAIKVSKSLQLVRIVQFPSFPNEVKE